MNINIEALQKEQGCHGNAFTMETIKRYEAKPYHCNNCAHLGNHSKCNDCSNAKHNLFEPKELEWFENPDNFPVLCVVWDNNDINRIELVKKYVNAEFLTQRSWYKKAKPLTKTELMKYCLEEY